ncbi:helix-turn-helix transcriptional regulator [Bacteroides acidifaciens]|uniref:helix-turn-helix domain-containing protein n=1 Tax=Bacteroides acidifaciens TaxID=85831 RepID=UPI0025923386|nr:helix-turn-helix transcriptional regulator [Bacteroides acidifaciens]
MKPIGESIHDRLRQQGRTVKEFADAIGYQRSNAYRIFNQASIDTELLMRISLYLEYDFFAEYSAEYHLAAVH